MRILITGINGFAASQLAKKLVEDGNEVHGTIRVRSDLYKIQDIADKIQLHLVEMIDSFSVEKVVKDVKPEEVYHLAAQSFVKSSWDSPLETYRTNVEGTINLLEAIKKLDYKPRVLNVSTSEVYGLVDGDINEQSFPDPVTHYGISKLTQDMIGRLYYRAFGIPVITSRSFNITGWGRAEVFVDSSFAKQVVEIERGVEPVIKHGNLDTERDFVDVKDVVEGYILALRKGNPGEIYCFASGKPRKIKEVLDTLIKNSTVNGIKDEIDPARLRPVDTKTMKGDASKAAALGWKPKISFEQSLIDLLNYWRKKL